MIRAETQFSRADRHVKRTAARITSDIKKLLDRWATEWPEVGQEYVVSSLLMELLLANDGILPMLDGLPYMGPATLKLSNALADYRDAGGHGILDV
jgi:hypothetical protein